MNERKIGERKKNRREKILKKEKKITLTWNEHGKETDCSWNNELMFKNGSKKFNWTIIIHGIFKAKKRRNETLKMENFSSMRFDGWDLNCWTNYKLIFHLISTKGNSHFLSDEFEIILFFLFVISYEFSFALWECVCVSLCANVNVSSCVLLCYTSSRKIVFFIN